MCHDKMTRRMRLMRVNEDKELTEETSWWVRGDGADDFEKKQQPSVASPLYLVNDVEHACKYAQQHSGRSLMTIYELDLNKDNVGVKILDLTSCNDLSKIGYSPLLAKIFSQVDAYFSWSMTSAFSNDRIWRPFELDFAYKFLLWKNGKANQTYQSKKDKSIATSSKPKSTLYKLIESKNTVFSNATTNDLSDQAFIDEYIKPRFSSTHEMDKRLSTIQLDIVNAYIDTFKTIHSKWDKNARKIVRDESVPMYVDNMLIMLMQDIKNAGYDGYFCPELKSRDANGSDNMLAYVSTTIVQDAKKVDTIAIINPDVVKQVFQCDTFDFEQFADVMPDKQKATKNSLAHIVDLVKEYDYAKTYAHARWKYSQPLELSFPTQILQAMLDIEKDPRKCMWRIWTDKERLNELNKHYWNNFPALNTIFAATCNEDDEDAVIDEILKLGTMQKFLKENRVNVDKFRELLRVERF